jgi:hypothetical protein
MYGARGFTQNVYDAFADCNDAEIKRLAMTHNIQMAFGRCGSNRFAHYRWSPDGVHLYFQLTHGSHILNGVDKTITTIPTEGPTARAAWLSTDILAIPLPPVEGQTDHRIVLYNHVALTLDSKTIPVREPADLTSFKGGKAVLFTALDGQDVRRPYSLDVDTGLVERALPWLDQMITRLDISEVADMVAWSTETDTEVARLSTGESLHLFKAVSRAVLHDSGRWIILETDGAEISNFNQRTWNELSPEAREREIARQKKWEARQPDWVELTARPPEIQLFDINTGKRYRITSFWGDEVQWYPLKGHYIAFMLWGIEGKQLNRNIGLTPLEDRIRMVDADQIPMGVELVQAKATPTTATAH